MSNTARNIAIVGGISLTYYLVMRHFDKKKADARVEKMLDETMGIDSHEKGGEKPGVSPGWTTHAVSTSIDGKRSAYMPPPGRMTAEEAKVAAAQAKVDQIRREGEELGRQVRAAEERKKPTPQKDARGKTLRTRSSRDCASLLAANDIAGAEKAGCDTELCEAYLQMVEENNLKGAQMRSQIDRLRLDATGGTDPQTGMHYSKARIAQKKSQYNRLVASTRRLSPMLKRHCG